MIIGNHEMGGGSVHRSLASLALASPSRTGAGQFFPDQPWHASTHYSFAAKGLIGNHLLLSGNGYQHIDPVSVRKAESRIGAGFTAMLL
jgi:hypothetical protein